MIGVGQFHGSVLECTSPETGTLEPVLEGSEKGPQLVFRPLAVSLQCRPEELQTSLFPILQDGQDQFVLRWKVLVETHLGDFGLGDDPVDADRPNTVLVEQPVGSFQDSLAGFRSGFRAFHA